MKFEKTLLFSFLVGLVLRLLHWPGGSLIIILSLGLMAIFYFPFAFLFFKDYETKKQNLLFSILSGLAFSFVPIGVMFKFQFWRGANDYLSLGAFFSLIIFLFCLVMSKKVSQELRRYYNCILRRSITLILISLILLIVPSATLIKINYWNDPHLAKLKQQHYLNPGDIKFKEEHDTYIMKQDSIENLRR